MSHRDEDMIQAKEELTRKIARVFPGCFAEWQDDADRGISFRLVDGHGRYRSNVVRVRPWHDCRFTRSWLERVVRGATGPEDGFPRV